MRVSLASIISAFLVSGCGNNDLPNQLDGANGLPDMSMGNTPPDLSNPDLWPQSCDPLKQDCTDPNKSKCAMVEDVSGTMQIPICVMPTGTKMTEDPCTRVNDMPSGAGYDDCAKGNYCSGLATLSNPPVRHCRNFCLLDTQCKNSEHCAGLIGDATGMSFIMGLCVPTCAAFGTDCGQGLNCSYQVPTVDLSTEYLSCRQAGQVGTGGACTLDSDCVADAICVTPTMGNKLCAGLCDMTHTCANGKTCTMIPMTAISVCL